MAEIVIALSHHIPVTVLFGHLGPVVAAYPATVSWLGLVCWAMAASVAFGVLAKPAGWRWGHREVSLPGPLPVRGGEGGPAGSAAS